MNESESRAALAGFSGPLPASDVDSLAAQHAAIQPRLRAMVRGLPARRRKQRLLRRAGVASGVLLSAGLVAALWLKQAAPAQPFAFERGSAFISSAGHGFVTGPQEPVVLRTLAGVVVSVSARSRVDAVTGDAHSEQVVLSHGSVSVTVPHLMPGSSFSVRTPDALVTVHGTVFSVIVSGDVGQVQTCVHVEQGVVDVRRGVEDTVLRHGESLNCHEPAASLASPTTQPLPAKASPLPLEPGDGAADPHRLKRPRAPAASQTAPPPLSGAEADATLAEQNRLLASALQAERAGNLERARSTLQELLTRYPDSALRAEAARSLERVQRKLP